METSVNTQVIEELVSEVLSNGCATRLASIAVLLADCRLRQAGHKVTLFIRPEAQNPSLILATLVIEANDANR